jgi:hypothetical protein
MTAVREERRQVGLQLADWSSSWLRWQTGAGLDRLGEGDDRREARGDARDYLALDGSLSIRMFRDRIALDGSGGWWVPFAGGNGFRAGELLAAWRSTDQAAVASWSATTEIAIASRMAPLAVWQGAGTGQGRRMLLRAHPLLADGVLTGQVFGREVASGSLEYARPMTQALPAGFSIAGFVDAARAWHRLGDSGDSPLYVDAGIGVRIRTARLGGGLRIDVAHGLRDGGTTLSAGWGLSWPR